MSCKLKSFHFSEEKKKSQTSLPNFPTSKLMIKICFFSLQKKQNKNKRNYQPKHLNGSVAHFTRFFDISNCNATFKF